MMYHSHYGPSETLTARLPSFPCAGIRSMSLLDIVPLGWGRLYGGEI